MLFRSKRKVDMARKYSKALKKLSLQLPVEREWAKNVIWMYSVLLKEDKSTKAFFEKDWLNLTPASYAEWPAYSIMKRIGQRGIQTRPFFIGIHEQPVFRKQGFFKNEPYPVTERIARTGFYLPSGQAITDLQIKKVCDTLKGLFL